jgi:hypothetical protein
LLPTPQARDHHGAQLPEQRRAGGHQVNLNDVARGLAKNWERDGWGSTGRRSAGGSRSPAAQRRSPLSRVETASLG